jgi:hypothetical protein
VEVCWEYEERIKCVVDRFGVMKNRPRKGSMERLERLR